MSSSFHKVKIPAVILFAVIALICAMAPARAERKYTLGTTVDFSSGASNQIGQSSFSLERIDQGVVQFYTVYPELIFKSEGQHSSLDLDYTCVVDRLQMSPPLTEISHAFNGKFTAQIGRSVHFKLADSLDTIADYSSINVLKGFAYTPEGFHYFFQPQLNKSSSLSNSASLGLDIDVSPKSFISFTAAGAHRIYNKSISSVFTPDQFRMEGDLGFSHRTSSRQIWGIKYKVWQNDFDNYYISRSHAAILSLSQELRPNLHLMIEAGPAYSEKNKALKSSVGYTVLVQLSKNVKKNLFTGGYGHLSGDGTGLGTITEDHYGTLGFSRSLGRKGALNFQASAFKQHQKTTMAYDYWNASGSVSLSRELGNYWVASIGGSYLTNVGRVFGSTTYRRVYASIGFRLPELWRGER